MNRRSNPSALAAVSVLALSAAQAHAATGTLAGTSVNNTATVGYAIGGVAQPTVSSNPAIFLVDRKANLTVAPLAGAPVTGVYGAADKVFPFTVTNTTNSTQDFRLTATASALGALTVFSHTDNILASNIRVFVDSNNNGTYEPGVDTAVYIDELAPDASKTVFVVIDLPASGPTLGYAGVNLTGILATGATPGTLGADLTASLVDDPNAIDTVFADGAGSIDLGRDGRFSAGGEYYIGGSAVEVSKFARLISDPLNGALAPKAIPGAVMEYCISTKNTTGSAITNVIVGDVIPANTTYVAGSTYVNGTFLAGACVLDGANVADGAAFSGTAVSTTTSTLAAGTTTTTRFRVTLN